MITRDTVIKSRGRKTGFTATKFRHMCTGLFSEQCQRCQHRINRDDDSRMRATKRIEWLKTEIRTCTDPYLRQALLLDALLYMRERVAGIHSDWETVAI